MKRARLSTFILNVPAENHEAAATPNETLFKLLLESLGRLNAREVALTDEDCSRFVRHIAGRERNGVPLPFPRTCVPGEAADAAEPRAPLKWRCFVRAVAAVGFCARLVLTFVPASFAHVKEMKRHTKLASGHRTAPEKDGKADHLTVDISTGMAGSMLRHAMPYHGVLRCVPLCVTVRTVLCRAILCCALPFCTVLCCAVLCCAALCCVVLRWAGLRWAGLRCAVLCCAVMCHVTTYRATLCLTLLTITIAALTDPGRSCSPTPTVEGDGTEFSFPGSVLQDAELHDLPPKASGGQARTVSFDVKGSPAAQKAAPFREEMQPEDDNVDGDSFCFNIPIYCFDCPFSVLTTIGNASAESSGKSSETTKKREDIFQDFTQSDAQIYADPFSVDEMPHFQEGRTRGLFGKSKDLLLHSNAVHDLFFRSFMSCIFSSLKAGQPVSARDVQSAVEACEENFVEIDITEFVRTLCRHYNNCMERENSPYGFTPILPSPVPVDGRPSCDGPPLSPQTDSRAPLPGQCESIAGLHNSIIKKFKSLLGRHFKAVPSSSDFYFYSPQLLDNSRKVGWVPSSFSRHAPVISVNCCSSCTFSLLFSSCFPLIPLPAFPPFCMGPSCMAQILFHLRNLNLCDSANCDLSTSPVCVLLLPRIIRPGRRAFPRRQRRRFQ